MENESLNENETLLRPSEVARQMAIGRTTIYAHIKAGKLKTVRFGRTIRILKSSLDELLAQAVIDG